MYLHANLNSIGTKGYGALTDRSVRLVRYMADVIMAHPLFEVVVQPMSNILLYRHVPTHFAGKYHNQREHRDRRKHHVRRYYSEREVPLWMCELLCTAP